MLSNTRQVGLAVPFGVVGFVFKAAGLVASVPLSRTPPIDIDLGALMLCLAGMATGPIIGIIVGARLIR